MKRIVTLLSALAIASGLFGCISQPIAMTPQTAQRLHAQPPIRFLLTFDDGPSASGFYNPTVSVLDDLARNPVQSGIKAVFFVQTRAARAGGSELGQKIMHREHDEGHVLGFHTATPGHANHRSLSPEELEQSLTAGSADIAAITGAAPTLLRPPFWNYDKRTFAAYQRHGLQVLLTDLSANDGKIWGYNFSLRRRSNLLRQLSEVRERIANGRWRHSGGGDFSRPQSLYRPASAGVSADPAGQCARDGPGNRRQAFLRRPDSVAACCHGPHG
jgi:peptidoglycan/xylan/chitin deacetylase (PgdA/CDA1 family)